MITALDAQPQEWMGGKERTFHTVAACHFKGLEHLEHWVNRLVPRNQNDEFVKWSGGRRRANTRDQFVDQGVSVVESAKVRFIEIASSLSTTLTP